MKKFIQSATLCLAMGALVAAMASAQSMDNNSSKKSSDQMSSDKAPSKTGGLTAADRTFVRKAAEGGMAEVELGKLAAEKGSSEEVRKFGQRMVDDHGKANDELKQLASSKGIELPSHLNAKDEATKERLSKLSGSTFDRAYMKDMVKDHTQDVSEFKRESKAAKDPDVKNFAAQTLPTLEDHLKSAKSTSPAQRTASAK